jgi:hypothetical protein
MGIVSQPLLTSRQTAATWCNTFEELFCDPHPLYVGILPTLKDRNVQLTVLVPTDSAFASTPPQRLNTSNTDTLQTVHYDLLWMQWQSYDSRTHACMNDARRVSSEAISSEAHSESAILRSNRCYCSTSSQVSSCQLMSPPTGAPSSLKTWCALPALHSAPHPAFSQLLGSVHGHAAQANSTCTAACVVLVRTRKPTTSWRGRPFLACAIFQFALFMPRFAHR